MLFRTLLAATLLCASALAQTPPMGDDLFPVEQATHVAVQSGSVQDAATWGGNIPGDGAKIHIPSGITVTNHGVTEDWLWVRVSGVLKVCDHCDTQINVHTVYIPMGGSMQLGMQNMPVQGKAVVEFVPGDFVPGDFRQLSLGVISHGEFMTAGKPKGEIVTVAHQNLPAGSTTMNVAGSTIGWQVGDKILVTGTDGMLGEDMSLTHRYQSEFVTVQSISLTASGATIGFSPALQYRHFRWRSDKPFYATNTTRNVVFRSRDPGTIKHRGHVMLMSSMSSCRYTSFEGMGRTDGSREVTDPRLDLYGELVPGSTDNVRARYVWHAHKIGQLSSPIPVVGCVVDGSPKWGFLNHDSNVNFQKCVAVHCFGAGFATEEGQERGSMVSCLSALNHGEGDYIHSTDDDHGRPLAADWGTDGSGFWLQGGMTDVINCISCDNSGRGFALFNRAMNGYPNYGTGNPIPQHLRFPITVDGSLLSPAYGGISNTPSSTVPQRIFSGNTAYNNKVGFQGWSGPTHDASGIQIWPLSVRGSISNLTLWGRGAKLHLEYTRQANINGVTIIGDNGFRPGYNSINKQSEAVLLRGPNITVTNWVIQGVQANMYEFRVEGPNDPGGIAAKNISIQGKTVNPDGSVN